MIKCPKCDADNQIGAIFCRGCGEKLELDELKPETVKEAAKSARGTKFNLFAWLKNTIMLGILAGLVLIFIGLFATPGTWNDPYYTDADFKAANSKLNVFYQGKKVKFTEAEINALMFDWFGLTDEQLEKYLKEKLESGEVGMIPRKLQVELLGDNQVRLTMFQQHNGKEFIKYYSVLEGTVEVSEGQGLTISPTGHAQGKVPFGVAGPLKEKIEGRFIEQYPAIQPFTDFIKAVKSVNVTAGEIELTGTAKPGMRTVTPKTGTGGRRRRR